MGKCSVSSSFLNNSPQRLLPNFEGLVKRIKRKNKKLTYPLPTKVDAYIIQMLCCFAASIIIGHHLCLPTSVLELALHCCVGYIAIVPNSSIEHTSIIHMTVHFRCPCCTTRPWTLNTGTALSRPSLLYFHFLAARLDFNWFKAQTLWIVHFTRLI